MIDEIKTAAQTVGIQLVITNSKERIETQLNSLTHNVERSPGPDVSRNDLPIMLVSWDIDTVLEFDTNSFLKNPESQIVALLVTKPVDLTKVSMETASVAMGALFTSFIVELNNLLKPLIRDTTPITKCSYKLVPMYGLGKHSGVLGKWNMKTGFDPC